MIEIDFKLWPVICGWARIQRTTLTIKLFFTVQWNKDNEMDNEMDNEISTHFWNSIFQIVCFSTVNEIFCLILELNASIFWPMRY